MVSSDRLEYSVASLSHNHFSIWPNSIKNDVIFFRRMVKSSIILNYIIMMKMEN